MGLHKEYPEDFERLYRVYPKWPKGRTKKFQAYRKFEQIKRTCALNDEDVVELIEIVMKMKKDRKTWQTGDPYGPKGLQHFLHSHDWDEEYVTVVGAFRAKDMPTPTPIDRANADRAHVEGVTLLKRQGFLRKVELD